MVILRSAFLSLECALAMQLAVRNYDMDLSDSENIPLCVGRGRKSVLRIDDHDVRGTEVNAAAKAGVDTAKSWSPARCGSPGAQQVDFFMRCPRRPPDSEAA